MKPLVSIIVPNYNHYPFLEQRLNSIFNQTFQNFEVLIFDDASTDNSLEILEQYKSHPKISHFIVNEKNSGSPFQQWVKGIELAKGDYIWIAETDDFAETGFLENTVAILNRDEKSGLVYVDSTIVDHDGTLIDVWSAYKNTFFNTQRWSSDYIADGKEEILDYLSYKVTINNASAVLFRKESLLLIDFQELIRYKNVGDLFVYLSVAAQGNISYLRLPLNNYREHLFNTTKKNQKTGLLYFERIKCYSQSLDLLVPKNNSTLDYKKLIKAYRFILKQNGFGLLDFGYAKELRSFMEKLVSHNILKWHSFVTLKFLFKIYELHIYKLSGLSKKIIKKSLKD